MCNFIWKGERRQKNAIILQAILDIPLVPLVLIIHLKAF